MSERLPKHLHDVVAICSRIAHGCDSIDDAIVMDTVLGSFPPLIERLEAELAGL